MKKVLLGLLLAAPFLIFSQSTSKKVLMVVSSYGKGDGETRPGYEFDEFSQAYLVFKSNGLSVEIASPKGGPVEADKYNMDKAYNQSVSKIDEAMSSLEHTLPTADIDPNVYDAIYIVGGKGAMFDLPVDPSLQDIILNLYHRDGTVISSVCHGPAAFVNVKDSSGYIINNVEMTSFCNAEEELFGKKWVPEFPFLLEDKLKSRGAIFQQSDFMLPQVSVSGKFVTGQNPFSTTGSAEAVVRALGIDPVDRELYQDERSAYLIQDVLRGDKKVKWAQKELEKNTDKYDMPLIAVYGYYKMKASAEDKNTLTKAVEIVELATPYFFNENLQLALAQSYVSIENKDRAKQILNELIDKELLIDKAEEMLQSID